MVFCMFSCLFDIFLYGVLGQVWYLIVWIPDLCLLPFFGYSVLSLENCTGDSVMRCKAVSSPCSS